MSRRDIHYWKCDRPAAFHGTRSRSDALPLISQALEPELRRHFNTKEVALQPAPTQGNHLAWTAVVSGNPVQLVSVPDVGIPRIGVTKFGLVANTSNPVPVSSTIAARRLALVGLFKKSWIAELKASLVMLYQLLVAK